MNLDPEFCRKRQQRLAAELAALKLDRAVLTMPEHVQYFTGFRPHKLMSAIVAVEADGSTTLVAPNDEPEGHAADRCVTFVAQHLCTLRQEMRSEAWKALGEAERAGDDEKIRETLWKLRRRKDPDELAMMRKAIDCTTAMYERAREIIEPGISELEVFNQLHAAAVRVAGEPLTDLGNDYQVCSPGGPPRNGVVAKDGDLYILDLGPAYRGYYADNCRTFSVNRKPTDQQLLAWERCVAVLDHVETTVKPGVRCAELFATAKGMLDEFAPDAFYHHLGHGVGLYPHETPHLNPNWDDVFEEGDVFTAEPGLYTKELQAGIRLEQNYRVTTNGVDRLTSFPLTL
ncbi:MAG: Xaa-Pro dipeptidase [Verrucomicrobiales bacterium]|jgi:Xaa-Pro dipeptidase